MLDDGQTLSHIDTDVVVERVETFVLSARPRSPAKSALGDLSVRHALLIRLTDRDGASGWGEIWCNFPPPGARHRAALVAEVLVPSLAGQRFESPSALSEFLTLRWRVLAHHTGETGPFTNAIAGLDIAAWDLVARRAGMSLAQAATGVPPAPTAEVYASSPNPDRIDEHVDEVIAERHRAIKLKVGYGTERDGAFVARVRGRVGDRIGLMVDANQSWSPEHAAEEIAALAPYGLDFIEEPIAGYLPPAAWGELARRSAVPLAGGENIPDDDALAALIGAKGVGVYQPSITKFGGVTGFVRTVRRARNAGLRVCPHYMGTAVGLAASLQLLATEDAPGRHELDANDNPLRTDLTDLDLTVEDGAVRVPKGTGIGVEPRPEPWLDRH